MGHWKKVINCKHIIYFTLLSAVEMAISRSNNIRLELVTKQMSPASYNHFITQSQKTGSQSMGLVVADK